MSRGGIIWTSDTLTPGLKAFPSKLENAVAKTMNYYEGRVQSAARNNAKWTDRTANARGGLFAKYIGKQGKHVIVLYHTMPYGIWLEVRWDGKYAIIEPTIKKQGAQLMKTLNKLISRMT